MNSDYKSLGYEIYTTVLKNHMQATLGAIIGENQSTAIKKYIYYTHFSPFDM